MKSQGGRQLCAVQGDAPVKTKICLFDFQRHGFHGTVQVGVILNWKIRLFVPIGDISIIDVLDVLKSVLEFRKTFFFLSLPFFP